MSESNEALVKRLESFQAKIKDAEARVARLEGQKEQLEQRLREEFDISNPDEAGVHLEEMERALKEGEVELTTMASELTEIMDDIEQTASEAAGG